MRYIFLKKFRPTLLGFFMCYLLFSCEPEENPIQNNELIFQYASEITIPSYNYLSESVIITVSGDAGYKAGSVDTLTPAPVIQWDSLRVTYIMAAIFSQPIEVENGIIVNTSDIVWIWHSGLDTGKEGYVEFSDGMQMVNGDLNNLLPPEALSGPARYYWGIWSWGHSGTRILYSSRPLTFFVK